MRFCYNPFLPSPLSLLGSVGHLKWMIFNLVERCEAAMIDG